MKTIDSILKLFTVTGLDNDGDCEPDLWQVDEIQWQTAKSAIKADILEILGATEKVKNLTESFNVADEIKKQGRNQLRNELTAKLEEYFK